jgi:hypothetical protein
VCSGDQDSNSQTSSGDLARLGVSLDATPAARTDMEFRRLSIEWVPSRDVCTQYVTCVYKDAVA